MVVVSRDERGVFEAQWGQDRFVRGWSATVDEMAAILHRYGVTAPCPTGSAVSTATVDNPEYAHAGRLDDDAQQWRRMLRSCADRAPRVRLRDALTALRDQIPAQDTELGAWLAQRTDRVNATAPQVDEVAVFGNGSPLRCASTSELQAHSECLEWVDARSILSTVDRVWGSFDRAERHRQSLEGFCLSLREADSESLLEAWIDLFTIGRLCQPVQLTRVEGPAGQVYQLRADGTHRAHFARVFDLPLMALVKTSPLPRPIHVIDHPYLDPLADGFGRMASLYMGLRARGLLEIEGNPPRPEVFSVWTPTWVCAEWLLLPPVDAAAVNQAYDRVYPGALAQVTGLTTQQLTDPHRWASEMARPPSRLWRARRWYVNRKSGRQLERAHDVANVPPVFGAQSR